jgi:ribonucleoside-diphosphate reductase alpha chain
MILNRRLRIYKMGTEKKRLTIGRYFTSSEKTADSYFSWEKNDIGITDDETGKKIFTQEGAEFPSQWSQLARKITAAKYFFGEHGTSQREGSVKDLVGRVSSTFAKWALKQHYFNKKDAQAFQNEIAYSSYGQLMAFNSPVWFNVGTDTLAEPSKERKEGWRIAEKDMPVTYPTPFGEVQVNVKKGTAIPLQIGEEIFYPQTAACFIQNVEDTMEGIMRLAEREALLFKYGSGTGTNLSTLRSSKEKLSGGGRPSGPLAYWAFYDKVAGIVKSGGKTRRASKMDILDVSHPDIVDFIESKKKEEEKLHILIDNGIPWEKAGESVNYQNTNISVRATDEFMQAVLDDKDWQTIPVHNKEMADKMPKYKAKELMRKISEATHFCGDPGMQFHDTINKWHTCKASGPINASNPCSEYMFIDNSSCNLASINLKAFMREDETFDTEAFLRVVRFTAIAQDLNVDNSAYPTREIAENSHRFRPLGMGYANLGSLVMSLGLPYDSEESRAIAASLTALMTGKVYETSTEMAESLGTFEEYEKNKESMLEVMKMHRDALKGIKRNKLPKGLETVLDEAEKVWDTVVERGEQYGFRNAQATVLAPTGTIGFMMDCDTKGVEPEIGLVQTKLLVGGGSLRLVNETVPLALKNLGYNKEQTEEIIKYIQEKETMEGAPYIKEEHLPVFDCSNKPKGFNRTISPMGHLKMMAAVQPFLSGAISKTVNLPEEATVEDIEQTYIDAWKMGIKAVAIYRDNSKRVQPLNFSKKEKGLEEKVLPVRKKLPAMRKAITNKFEISGHEGYLTIGMYPDGSPGELFITMSKEGSTVSGLMDAIGILTSLSLQYGVPVPAIVKKFRHQKFEPYGLVRGHPEIHTADSITDYIAAVIEEEFLPKEERDKERNGSITAEISAPLQQPEKKYDFSHIEKETSEPAGGFCASCGTQMLKKGNCKEVCPKCGWENPKGCGE